MANLNLKPMLGASFCGEGIAFDGRTSNGETYDFGSSGFLYRSNTLMYDAGGEVRAFDRGDEAFSPGESPDEVTDAQGRVWLVT